MQLRQIIDPNPNEIGDNIVEFLRYLGGATEIWLTGQNTQRTRAFVTLLHGNEPSGLMALFRWLKSGVKPAINIACVVANVPAALQAPMLSQRVYTGQPDLNRCFKKPFRGDAGALARAILGRLKEVQPESLIDMHNTSGTGPSFAVATYIDDKHDALTSIFTQRLIVTHLRLGALMEVSEFLCPTVTIECGGREDEHAHELAWEGLNRYFMAQDVLDSGEHDLGLELLNNPVRLELKADTTLAFSEKPLRDVDVTLLPSVEHFNAGITPADTQLGWCSPDIKQLFSAVNSTDSCVVRELVYVREGRLYTARALKLFMFTCDPDIAKMDCLFYAVKSDGREVISSL